MPRFEYAFQQVEFADYANEGRGRSFLVPSEIGPSLSALTRLGNDGWEVIEIITYPDKKTGLSTGLAWYLLKRIAES